MGKKVTDYLLYRWRYVIGYGVIGLIIMALLVVAGLFIPGGLSQPEINTVVDSGNLSIKSFDSIDPSVVINLPYHLLQRASIELLGVTHLSVKLPSLILGSVSIVGMILLLQMWFRRNVAILTTILVITTGQFLFVAQSGTPSIVYIFWSVWLLVAAMMISRGAKHTNLWKIALFSIAALSLYTPLSIYILVALASAVILHPHLRYLVRRVMKAKAKVTVASLCALLLIAPLIYAIVLDPSIGLMLLGIPDVLPNLATNAAQLLNQYFGFTNPGSGTLMTPVYGLGSMVLIVLGGIQLFTTNYTARSYIISAWIILLLPVLLINPDFSSITFIPAMLLMAMGINTLLRSWYQLFPRNPYARIAGLIPLTILIGGMMLSGVGRYVYGYSYDPDTASNFSNDLQLVNHALDTNDQPKTALLVSANQAPFYQVVAGQYDNVTVTTDQPASWPPLTLVSSSVYDSRTFDTPDAVLTDSSSVQADRFYVYKTDQK